MERNELIERLEYVLALIQKTIQLNNERANIRKQYNGEIPLQPHYVITRKDNPTLYFGIIALVTVLLSIPINIPIGKTGLATTIIPVSVHMFFTAILMLITKIPGISLLGGFIPVLFIAKLTIKPITKFLNNAEAEKQHQISTLPKLEKTSEETETKIAEYRAMMSTESGEIFNGETMVSTPNKAWVYKLELTEDALIVHGSLDRTYEGEKKPTLVPDGMHTFKIDQNSDVPDYVKNTIKREGNNPSAGGFSLRAAGNTLLSVAMAD